MRPKSTLNNINVEIDILMIDMNGILHRSAQKIYKYGDFKPPKRLLAPNNKINNKGGIQTQIKVFKDICDTVDHLINITNPKKKIILCIDGVAPTSKQNQQRQRRFRSALESYIIFF